MNKSFKTNAMRMINGKKKFIEQMKSHALMSCHIKVGEPIPLKDHPLASEVLEKIKKGEIVFS